MAGYPSRTPGELGRLSDRVDALEGQLRRVLSPTAEQYAQAVESLRGVTEKATQTATLAQSTATQAQQTADALPIIQTSSGDTFSSSQAGAGSGWFEWVTLELEVAEGKTSVEGIAAASCAFVDMTTGGLAYINMRIRIGYPSGNQYSVSFPSAKQSGASAVNNVCTGNMLISQTQMKPGQKITVGIQVNASNPSAFPGNSGNFVTATAIVANANNP